MANPEDFPPGSAAAEHHLERLLSLGYPDAAADYAARKNLLPLLQHLENAPEQAAPLAPGRPQIPTLLGGLVLVWMAGAILFRSALAVVFRDSRLGGLDFRLLIASIALLTVAAVILASMTKASLQTLRRPLRIGLAVAWVAGLVTALFLR